MNRSTYILLFLLCGLGAGCLLSGGAALLPVGRAMAAEDGGEVASPAPVRADGQADTASPGATEQAADDSSVERAADVSQAEWQDEYGQFSELVKRYNQSAGMFEKDVQTIIRQKYKEEMERIQQTYDTRFEKLDDELSVRREQAISAFERFIQKYPNSSQTPLAMFRLAELYYDQSSYDFIVAQSEYDQLLREIDMSDTDSLPPEPKYDFSKCLALYNRIIAEFDGFEHIDAVYYMRGYLLDNDLASQNDPEAAKETWMTLIQRRPDSEYASQAYLRIGEYYFERGRDSDLLAAIDYYQRVMSYQDKWYDRALYKVAWSYYKLSDYENAIGRFVDLVDFSQSQYEETGVESDLRTEAVEYLAISFADDGDVSKALAYFDRIGGRPYKFEVLKKLADIYYKQAKFEQSIETYRNLQILFPDNEENPNFQHEIVSIYQKLPIPEMDKALAAKEELIRRYSPDSDWAMRQGMKRTAVTRAQELAQTMLQELAYYYNILGEEATSPVERQRYYAIAAEKYKEYLQRFPYSKNAYELQFFYAECLFFSQRFEESAVEYEKAMTSTEPKYHADAARGRTDSYMELVRRTEGDEGVRGPFPDFAEAAGGQEEPTSEDGTQEEPALEVRELSPLKKKYVQAIDVLARVAPSNKEVPNFLYIAAQMHYYHHQFDEAQQRYEAIIELFPTNTVAVSAAANLVDGLIQQKRWVDVQRAVEKFVGLSLGDNSWEWARVRDQLADAARQAKAKEAIELAANMRFAEAHERFKDAGTDGDLLNAAKIMDQLGNVDVTIEDYKELVRKYPRSEHVPFALFRIAQNYEKLFDLERAIEYYEQLAREFPDYERAPMSVNNAAQLRIGLHQYKKAAAGYEKYSRDYPEQSDAELLMYQAGKLREKGGDYEGAIRTSREYLKRYSRVNGDRHMETYRNIWAGLEEIGRTQESRAMEQRAPEELASLQGLPSFTQLGVHFYAEIMFREMKRTMDEFLSVSLAGNMRALELSLDRKNRLKDQLEAMMKDMIRIGDLEWSMAALYDVGLAYHSFAESLRDAVPPELGEEDRIIYMQTLEDEFIFKFEDRALEYYKRVLDLEETQKVWNKWVEQTYVQLNRLRPDLYPARKKEEIKYDVGEQHFSAPPITTMPMSDASAWNSVGWSSP